MVKKGPDGRIRRSSLNTHAVLFLWNCHFCSRIKLNTEYSKYLEMLKISFSNPFLEFQTLILPKNLLLALKLCHICIFYQSCGTKPAKKPGTSKMSFAPFFKPQMKRLTIRSTDGVRGEAQNCGKSKTTVEEGGTKTYPDE
jgi:hypothetical protein